MNISSCGGFSKCVIISLSAILHAMLVASVIEGSGTTMVKNDSDDKWVHRALLLDQKEFMQVCRQVFLRQEHLQKSSYLMSDYAEEVSDLCTVFAPNPEQGTCRKNEFSNLAATFQNTFFRHASSHIDADRLPVHILMSMGDAGYIVSDKTKVELDSMRNDLCVELHTAFGEEFLNAIPDLNVPEITQFESPIIEEQKQEVKQVNKKETKSPTNAPTVAAKSLDLNVSEDNANTDALNNGSSFEITEVKGDHSLSIGAMVGISCAVALCIALFFYSEARRRDRARNKLRTNFGPSEGGLFKMKQPSPKTKSRNFFRSSGGASSSRSCTSTYTTSVEDIREAINEANWDQVYKLASHLAENDDGFVPDVSGFKDRNRDHLSAEDQERSKILDDLADKGDWTGLAVTAALYSGETSSCSPDQSETQVIDDKRPSTVHLSPFRSSNNHDIEEGQSSMESLVGKMSEALNAGDWSQVNYFATKIKNERGNNSFDTDTDAFVLSPPGATSNASFASADTNDTEFSKKQTIEKLMRAGKWKGISIMANMYEMESKQAGSYPSKRHSYSPSHQQKDRTFLRTKELRYSDRVQDNVNIVSFRRDP